MTAADFTHEDAVRLVQLTYRTNPAKLPLRGKEGELLAALNEAKRNHDEAFDNYKDANEFSTGLRDFRNIADQVTALHNTWNKLTHGQQEYLANFVFQDDHLKAYMRNVEPDKAMLERLEKMKELFLQLTLMADGVYIYRGRDHRPEALVALKAFIVVLKDFWEKHAHFEKFNMQKVSSKVNSSASKLVLAAAEHLGQGYTFTNCDSVINPRNTRQPRNKKE